MIKIKGKEYPVSFFKLTLADPVVARLDGIRNFLHLANNIEAFTVSINTTFNLLQAAIHKSAENNDVKEATDEAIQSLENRDGNKPV